MWWKPWSGWWMCLSVPLVLSGLWETWGRNWLIQSVGLALFLCRQKTRSWKLVGKVGFIELLSSSKGFLGVKGLWETKFIGTQRLTRPLSYCWTHSSGNCRVQTQELARRSREGRCSYTYYHECSWTPTAVGNKRWTSQLSLHKARGSWILLLSHCWTVLNSLDYETWRTACIFMREKTLFADRAHKFCGKKKKKWIYRSGLSSEPNHHCLEFGHACWLYLFILRAWERSWYLQPLLTSCTHCCPNCIWTQGSGGGARGHRWEGLGEGLHLCSYGKVIILTG